MDLQHAVTLAIDALNKNMKHYNVDANIYEQFKGQLGEQVAGQEYPWGKTCSKKRQEIKEAIETLKQQTGKV